MRMLYLKTRVLAKDGGDYREYGGERTITIRLMSTAGWDLQRRRRWRKWGKRSETGFELDIDAFSSWSFRGNRV